MTANTNVKNFITWLAGAGKQAMLAYEDKKITLQEVLGFLPLAMEVQTLIPQADEAWKEVTSSDAEAIVDTLNHAKTELSYLSEATVKKVTGILGALMFTATAVSEFKTAALPEPGAE